MDGLISSTAKRLHEATNVVPWLLTQDDFPSDEQKMAIYKNPHYKQLNPIALKLDTILHAEVRERGGLPGRLRAVVRRRGHEGGRRSPRPGARDIVTLAYVVRKVARGCLIRVAARSLHLPPANSAPFHELLAASLSSRTESAPKVCDAAPKLKGANESRISRRRCRPSSSRCRRACRQPVGRPSARRAVGPCVSISFPAGD